MKRYIFAIIALMLCCGLRAQTRTCRYWFDGNLRQSVTTSFSGNTWDGQIDVSQLPDGIHSLHFYLTDTTSTPVRGYLFHKISTVPTPELKYNYWFDNDQSNMQSGTLGNGTFILDASRLSTGVHTLHLILKGSNFSSTRSYLFIKTEVLGDFTYHCWFDEDISTEQTGALGDGNILLDVTELENGVHTLYMYLEGSTLTAPQTFVFTNNLAVDEYEYGSLVMYPNPVKNRLMIESDEVIRQCEIYDLAGQLVKTLENDSERMEIFVESLPAGTYLVRLVTDKFATMSKFVKK